MRARPAAPRGRLVVLAGLLIARVALGSLVAGCEQTNHERINRWMQTEKGPGKLRSAVRDRELDPDLRAHAAQNLIRMDEIEPVLAALGEMPEDMRQAVLGKLVPRLWEDARMQGENIRPSAEHSGAKDALFDVRRLAEEPLSGTIDDYLVEWLAGGYFSGRARAGRHRGEAIIRAIGTRAAPRLIASAKAVLAAPPDASGARLELEGPLLVGLAATGSPDAVEVVLDLVTLERGDPRLPQRAFDALHQAFIDNDQLFPVASGEALEPHLDRLARFAHDEGLSNQMVNHAIRLIGAAGPPACMDMLLDLVRFDHANPRFTWVAAMAAVRCGKAQAVVAVAEALPGNRGYTRTEVTGFTDAVVAIGDAAEVARAAKTLLGSERWVARMVGVELFAQLAAKRKASAGDAAAVRALSADKTVLRGWWGDQAEVPKRRRQKEPRLGMRADEVAKQLDPLISAN